MIDGGVAPPRPEPLDPHQAPPHDRYCDMVLKGGVVDGVVYPWAIMELARAYRFKNISGTSVGAVAAALTAAAEYSRRYGSEAGFNEVLLKVPEKLAEGLDGGTRLFSLFQPSAGGAQRLFKVFVAAFGKGQRFGGLVEAYGLTGLAGAVVAVLFAWRFGAGWVSGAIHALFAAAMAIVMVVGWDLLALARQGFGLCFGKRQDPLEQGRPAFTDWLHEGIQAASGRPLDQPLTFRHLWEAPGGLGAASAPLARPMRQPRSIDLRMISTSLSHGRPYGLPLAEDGSRLFFRPEELAPYFPESVMAYLCDKARPYAPQRAGDPAAGDYLELPRGDLPVIVATRMSLSFPVLFKAVPLYAIDDEGPGVPRQMRRCWFADGGICSNFMIHQFDAILPKWPTFGIALESARDERQLPVAEPATVVVTEFHAEGREEVWNRFDPGPGASPPVGTGTMLKGFLVSLLDATKDWNDNTSMRMSGTRDRIARIKLKGGGESALGGLNLRLSGAQIMEMARDYGWPAGKKLVDKFSPERGQVRPGQPTTAGWDEHRWVRFQSFVHGLRDRVNGFEAASEQAGYCLPLSQQIEHARQAPPLRGEGEEALTKAQADALQATRLALIALEKSFADIRAVQPYKPVPPPEMRLRMPL